MTRTTRRPRPRAPARRTWVRRSLTTSPTPRPITTCEKNLKKVLILVILQPIFIHYRNHLSSSYKLIERASFRTTLARPKFRSQLCTHCMLKYSEWPVPRSWPVYNAVWHICFWNTVPVFVSMWKYILIIHTSFVSFKYSACSFVGPPENTTVLRSCAWLEEIYKHQTGDFFRCWTSWTPGLCFVYSCR